MDSRKRNEMGDLITLSCPACGGKLEISPNTLTLKCQYCGTEHMVHREYGSVMLEAFARCPVCNRNDRSEKLTGIQALTLVQRLSPPKMPEKPELKLRSNWPDQFIGCGAIVALFSLIVGAISIAGNGLTNKVMFAAIAFGGSMTPLQ